MGETVLISDGIPCSIRAGEIFGEKYRLERELGRGSMGTVWAAMHLSLGQRVAIKLISSEFAQSSEARTRFSTEAKAAARLRSRHVVQVYDDGETPQGTPYIVMEYLEGESLEARLEREKAVPLVDAVRITAQVARGLARAHAQGVVHRDLKPGNIFLARNDDDELGWTAKVLDFGIAKVDEQRDISTTKTGVVLGTPLFMSPEQIRGASSVDFRADIYSLGMVFYNMVTGRYAHESASFGDVLVLICTAELPDIRDTAPWLSDGVGTWFRRCCAREPSDRFQSAAELVEALQLAVGAPLPLVSGRAEGQLGPSGTIQGHLAPVSGRTESLGVEDSGSFTLRLAESDTAGSKSYDLGQSEAAASVLTVHDPGETKRDARRPLLAAGLIAVGVASLTGGVGLALFGPQVKPASVATAGLPVSHVRETARPKNEPAAPINSGRAVVESALPAPEVAPAPSASTAPAGSRAAPANPKSVAPSRKGSAKPPPGPPRSVKSRAPTDLGF